MPIPRIWYRYSPSPPPSLVNVVQSGPEMIHTDFSIVFLGGSGGGGGGGFFFFGGGGGGGGGGVFVFASAFGHGNIHFP